MWVAQNTAEFVEQVIAGWAETPDLCRRGSGCPFWKEAWWNLKGSPGFELARREKDLQHQFSSVAQSCPTLCDPMNRSMPGLPVHHQLPESTPTHVHRVDDAIQPSHPLSPPAFSLSQHQGLFQWVRSLHQVAKNIGVSTSASVLPMNIQDWLPLGWIGLSSLQSKGLWTAFCSTTVQKHQFFGAQLSL